MILGFFNTEFLSDKAVLYNLVNVFFLPEVSFEVQVSHLLGDGWLVATLGRVAVEHLVTVRVEAVLVRGHGSLLATLSCLVLR
jgi:hypothetical protein